MEKTPGNGQGDRSVDRSADRPKKRPRTQQNKRRRRTLADEREENEQAQRELELLRLSKDKRIEMSGTSAAHVDEHAVFADTRHAGKDYDNECAEFEKEMHAGEYLDSVLVPS
jgi:hypothetical protein